LTILEQSFIQISTELGQDHMLVQGAGGNTSFKKDEKMWIKASGKWLEHSSKENTFVLVDVEKIRSNIENNKANSLDGAVIDKSALRPSIETTLHALMKHKVVLHCHPVVLLSLLIQKDGKLRLTKLLRNFDCEWVPYVRPGIELTKVVQKVLERQRADVLLLGNHGLVVGGKDSRSAFETTRKIIDCCRLIPRVLNIRFDQGIEILAKFLDMRLPEYEVIHSLAIDDISYGYCVHESGVLYPDQAVFLGPVMPCYNGIITEERISRYFEVNKSTPFIILKGKGVLVLKDAKVDVDEMLRCHAEVLMRIGANEKLNYLTEDEISKLLDWEPEKYRRRLNQ